MKFTKIGIVFVLGMALAAAWLLVLNPNATVYAANEVVVSTTTDEYDTVGSGAGCSLREAVQTVHDAASFGGCTWAGNAKILVPGGTYMLTLAGADENSNALGDLDILVPMTVQGAGHASTIVDGVGLDRVFHVNIPGGGTVTLLGMHITGGNPGTSSGGGILSNNDLRLIDIWLVENTAWPSGGGLAFSGDTLAITATRAISNEASSGGGIYINDGAARFTNNSQVVDNTASSFGGGVYVNDGGLLVLNSRINHNTSTAFGGGIYAYESDLWLNNALVQENYADSSGGGIMLIYTSTATLRNSEVSSNTSDFTGGGIYVGYTSTLTLTNVTQVDGNQATSGGGIYAYEGSNVILSSARVMSNTVTSSGGGIYMYGVNCLLQGSPQSVISGNNARYGGGVYVREGHFNFDGTEVEGNSATYRGGGVSVFAGTVLLNGGRIAENKAVSYGGGGVDISAGGAFTQTLGMVRDNHANTDGGGIAIAEGQMNLVDGFVLSNTVEGQGGGIWVYSSTVLLDGTDVLSNTANPANNGVGGGIYMTGASTVLTQTANSRVVFNSADFGGGIAQEDGRLTIQGGLVLTNSADHYGGGIYVISGTVVLRDVLVAGNHGNRGGGLFIRGTGDYSATNLVVRQNQAVVSGGGIYAEVIDQSTSSLQALGSFSITGGEISSNVAGNGLGGNATGGGIVSANGMQVVLDEVMVSGNSASNGRGGGIYVTGQDTELLVYNSQVTGNQAYFGGGIAQWGGLSEISGTLVASNTADYRGGGLYIDAGELNLSNVTVYNNDASNAGGGLAADEDGGVTLRFVTLAGNTAGTYAEGIYQYGNDVTVTLQNSIVAGNGDTNCAGTLVSEGYNIDDGASCGFDATSDKTDTDPLLGALGDHGGTPTLPLLAGSPAIDAGLCLAGIVTDQRGEARPNPVSSWCDIGAYESDMLGEADLSISKAASVAEAAPGDTFDYTLSFSNNGTAWAGGVVVADAIPDGLTLIDVASSLAITDTGSSTAWEVQNLAPGQSGVITLTVEVGNVSAGTLTNLAEISTDANDPQSDNDQSDVDVTIQNTTPVLSTADQSATEGTSYTGALGNFVDVADDTHTATVNWGDGSATEAATVDQGANTISGVHTYAEDGDYTVSVTVTDNKGGADTATFTMAVSNADPQATPAADQTALTGEAITLTLATFTDAGVEDTHTATVDWGDGSATEAATVDQDAGEVSGSHVYASEGTVTVTVTVEDDDGGSVAVTFEVVVTRSGYEVFLPFTRK